MYAGGEGLLRTTARNSQTKDGEWSNFVVGEHALVEFVVCRLPGCHSRNCGVCGGKGCIYNQDVKKMIQDASGIVIEDEKSFASGIFCLYLCTVSS